MFTREALASGNRARDANTNLLTAQAGHIEEQEKAALASIKGKTQATRRKSLISTLGAMVDVSDKDLTPEEATEFAKSALEGVGAELTPANIIMATGMMKGLHSDALSALDVEIMRAEAFSRRTDIAEVRAIPPGESAFLNVLTKDFERLSRSLNMHNMIINRPGMSPEMVKSSQAAVKRISKERDEIKSDLLRGTGRANQAAQGQTQPQLPTINSQADLDDLDLKPGDQFIWGPTGAVGTVK